ncbi:hypothetical protein ACH4C6_14100 [Streptomyces sp. NPDC017943]|uniref:hypothetical protein n=1 Tax=Streptomyces sp. NPDC017943 TaxID=3365019 RepID=UPI00379594D9
MSSTTTTAAAEDTLGRPARPERPAGYWERIDRIVSAAPPLSDDQRARIRAAFHQPAMREAA